MSEENIVRYSVAEILAMPRQTDLTRFNAITDEEIDAAIADDPDEAGFAPDSSFSMVLEPGELMLLVSLFEPEVLAWLYGKGDDWRAHLAAVVSRAMRSERELIAAE